MPTPFVMTTFALLTTLNGAGELAPVDKALLPPGVNGPITWNMEACRYLRGRMPDGNTYAKFSRPPSKQRGCIKHRAP
jgi:hypothetical protein